MDLFGLQSRRAKREEQEEKYGDRLPPGQHIVQNWPVLTYGPTPNIETDAWLFNITGMVDQEQSFDLPTFKKLGQSTVHADFHCVTRFSIMDNDWAGVPVTTLMNSIDLQDAASAVMIHCYGGYTTNLLLEDFVREENLFAFARNNIALADEHGGPVRLIVPHLYAWKSAKWVSGVEFIDSDRPGFWEANGYHMRGDPFAEERFA